MTGSGVTPSAVGPAADGGGALGLPAADGGGAITAADGGGERGSRFLTDASVSGGTGGSAPACAWTRAIENSKSDDTIDEAMRLMAEQPS
jgi:hypothetical protein